MLSKLSFVVGVCLMTIVAQAQITLDQNDFPYGGLSLPRYFAWTWQDSIGNPGAGQAYDFSHLVIAGADTINYFNANSTPFAAQHPGANVATVAIEDALTYRYFVSSNLAFWQNGQTIVGDFGEGLDTLHANHQPGLTDTLVASAYTFGHIETEQSLISTYIDTFVEIRQRKFKVIQVDGWGSLKTPFATFDDILRIKFTEILADSIFVFGNLEDHWSDTLYYYQFWAKKVGHPIVLAHANQWGHLEWLEVVNVPLMVPGCMDSAAINYNPNANLDDGSCIYCNSFSYSSTPDLGICPGESVVLEVLGGAQWLWSTGETTSVINLQPDSSQNVSVLISNQPFCWEQENVNITVYEMVQAGFWADPGQFNTADTVLFVNTSTNAINWQWDFGDGTSSNLENPKHRYLSTGTYTATLIAGNPCFSDTFMFSFQVSVGVDELNAGTTEISIFPNPASVNPTISLNLSKPAVVNIQVYQVTGELVVLNRNNKMAYGPHQIQLFENNQVIEAGVYLVEVRINGQRWTRKWVKF